MKKGKIKTITDGVWEYSIAGAFLNCPIDYEIIKEDIIIFAEEMYYYLKENKVKIPVGEYTCNIRYIVRKVVS